MPEQYTAPAKCLRCSFRDKQTGLYCEKWKCAIILVEEKLCFVNNVPLAGMRGGYGRPGAPIHQKT